MGDFDRLDALLELCSRAQDAFLAADAALEANPSDAKAQAAFDAAEAAFDAARAAYDACAKAMMAEAASENENESTPLAALITVAAYSSDPHRSSVYERDGYYRGEGLPTHVAARGPDDRIRIVGRAPQLHEGQGPCVAVFYDEIPWEKK